jgi:hypothetical protein
LILSGTRNLLESGGIRFQSIPIHELENENRQQGTLLIPGSEALAQPDNEGLLPDIVCKASRCFQKVIILPSRFDPHKLTLAKCLAEQNVYAFGREVQSYTAIKDSGRGSLGFDCALFLHKFQDRSLSAEKTTQDRHPLLALRNDQASVLKSYGFKPHPLVNQDISLTMTNLESWLGVIDRVLTVVTDRLYVAVASVLLGKQLFYLDSHSQKLSTYFKYTFRDTFDHQIVSCSVPWLVENKFIVPLEERI